MYEWIVEPYDPEVKPPEFERIEIRHPWLARFDGSKRVLRGQNYRFIKRVMDLSLVLVTAPIWLLVVGICALSIKLEDPQGSVFFVQVRTRKGGQRFNMYKLRTMVMDAEMMKQELEYLNELQFPDFKITNDPRVTKIGRFLRATSLDELPQVINVLKGEMSLVGPRPTSFEAQTYALWQTERLDVIPGITGLWQLLGRGNTEFDVRLRMDIAYIERRSLWLDIQILFRTLIAVAQQRGAY